MSTTRRVPATSLHTPLREVCHSCRLDPVTTNAQPHKRCLRCFGKSYSLGLVLACINDDALINSQSSERRTQFSSYWLCDRVLSASRKAPSSHLIMGQVQLVAPDSGSRCSVRFQTNTRNSLPTPSPASRRAGELLGLEPCSSKHSHCPPVHMLLEAEDRCQSIALFVSFPHTDHGHLSVIPPATQTLASFFFVGHR
jgi:hypothetical protein